MTLSELMKILEEIKILCMRVDEDPDNVPIRIFGEHGIPQRIEFEAVGIVMSRKTY